MINIGHQEKIFRQPRIEGDIPEDHPRDDEYGYPYQQVNARDAISGADFQKVAQYLFFCKNIIPPGRNGVEAIKDPFVSTKAGDQEINPKRSLFRNCYISSKLT